MVGCIDIIETNKLFNSFVVQAYNDTIPFIAFFELTSDCNAHCPFCLRPPTDRFNRGEQLTFAEVKELLHVLYGMGCLFLSFTGGEPLLWPDFDSLLAYARRLGFAVSISTNGFLLDQDRIRRYADLGVHNIIVSIHSIRDNMYQSMFGVRRSVAPVLESIARLREYHIPSQIAFTATKHNIDEFYEVKSLAFSYGYKAHEVNLGLVHERGDGNLLAELYPSDEQIRNMYLRNPEQTGLRARRSDNTLCVAGRCLVSIDFLGNVQPCTIFEWPAGNLHEQSFEDIWTKSPVFQRIRAIQSQDFACQRCGAFKYCGICIARNYTATGDLTKPSASICREAKLCWEAAELIDREESA